MIFHCHSRPVNYDAYMSQSSCSTLYMLMYHINLYIYLRVLKVCCVFLCTHIDGAHSVVCIFLAVLQNTLQI